MSNRWWRRESDVERRLRAARPEAPDGLVEKLAAQARAQARTRNVARVPRLAFAAVASAVVLVGLAAVGGVGRAASEIAHVASIATGHTNVFGHRMAVRVVSSSAANDQYGSGGSSGGSSSGGSSSGGGTTTTTTSTTTTSGTTTTSSTTTTSTSTASSSGSVTVAAPAGGTAPVQVSWPAGTFTSNVVVNVNSAPPQVTSSALLGAQNQLVSIVVTNSSGQVVHTLAAPLDVVFANPPKNFVPVVSTDGVNFRALVKVPGPGLPAGQQDGYYIDANGTIHILTMHLTIFAVLYSANVNVSATGKKLPQAGSGLFGDPTRNTSGAPVLQQVGSTITPVTSGKSTLVPFTFHVNKQAATYISIYDANGNPVTIERTGTVYRGHVQSGTPVKSLHVVILRPGQIVTKLRVPTNQLKSGATYKIRVTAVDFDGEKTVEYVTFTA